jgi:hypothetical protein
MIAKRVSWATISATLDAMLTDQSATGRVDPLLVAKTAKEILCNLGFGEPRFAGYKRQNVVSERHARSIHDPSPHWQDQGDKFRTDLLRLCHIILCHIAPGFTLLVTRPP